MEKKFLIERTSDAKDLPLPVRQTPQSAGLDLCANVMGAVIVKKGERALIPVGVKVALPVGYEAQIRSRSGLALKFGVAVLNSPGTVDADYRGEVKVLLVNHGAEDFQINRSDRIAQMIIAKVETADFIETDELPVSLRGEGGYGSTGLK